MWESEYSELQLPRPPFKFNNMFRFSTFSKWQMISSADRFRRWAMTSTMMSAQDDDREPKFIHTASAFLEQIQSIKLKVMKFWMVFDRYLNSEFFSSAWKWNDIHKSKSHRNDHRMRFCFEAVIRLNEPHLNWWRFSCISCGRSVDERKLRKVRLNSEFVKQISDPPILYTYQVFHCFRSTHRQIPVSITAKHNSVWHWLDMSVRRYG